MSSDRTFTTNISTRGILGSSEICFWRELCPWPCWVSSQCCPRSPSELRRRKSSLHSPTPLDAFGLGLGLGSARCSDLHSPDPSTPPASAQDPLVSCGRGNPLSIPHTPWRLRPLSSVLVPRRHQCLGTFPTEPWVPQSCMQASTSCIHFSSQSQDQDQSHTVELTETSKVH